MDNALVGGVLAAWHAANPRIRRVFAFGMPADDIYVVVDLEPVMDSDETLPVWLSRADAWKAELQERTSRTVHLAWMEPGESAMPVVKRGGAALGRIWVSESFDQFPPSLRSISRD